MISFLPYLDRGLLPRRGYGYGSEEHFFDTIEEARAFWRRLRHERRAERIALYQHDERYAFQRKLLVQWEE